MQIWRSAKFEFEDGPALPERLQSHCAVNAAGKTLMVLGGRNDDVPYLDSGYSYDLEANAEGTEGEWEALPAMPGGVRGMACAYVEGKHGPEVGTQLPKMSSSVPTKVS